MADKIDIPSFQIAASKMRADGSAYFKLFEKYVPRNLDINNVVLLYKLDNLSCIYNIINMNSKAHYFVVSNTAVNTALRAVLDKAIDVKYIEEFDFKKTDMKFDCIIMNPPYQREKHLEILAEAEKHIKDCGKAICLHPSKWIRRFDYWNNKWNKFKVENVEFIDSLTSKTAFESTAIGSQLAITVLSNGGSTDYKKYSRFIPWVKEKIIDKSIVFKNKNSKYRTYKDGSPFQLNLPIVHGHLGELDMTEITSKDYTRALAVKFGKRPGDVNSLTFNSENERKNFYDSLFTNFYKFLILICRDGQTAGSCYYALPFLPDYTKPWDDARLYKYFNLTDEEIKTIESTIEKFNKTKTIE